MSAWWDDARQDSDIWEFGRPTSGPAGDDPMNDCRRCFRRYPRSRGDRGYCSDACREGWTPRVSFEDYYCRMHPARAVWVDGVAFMSLKETGTDPVR